MKGISISTEDEIKYKFRRQITVILGPPSPEGQLSNFLPSVLSRMPVFRLPLSSDTRHIDFKVHGVRVLGKNPPPHFIRNLTLAFINCGLAYFVHSCYPGHSWELKSGTKPFQLQDWLKHFFFRGLSCHLGITCRIDIEVRCISS